MNNKSLLVASREYKSTVMTKAFIIGAVILPLVIWGLAIAIPMLVKDEIPMMNGTIAVVDETGQVASVFESQLSPEFLQMQHDQLEQFEADEYLRKSTEVLKDKGQFAQQLAVTSGRRAIERMKEQPVHQLKFTDIKRAEANIDELKQQVVNGELLALVWIKADALTASSDWLAGLMRGAMGGALGGALPKTPADEEAKAKEPSVVIYTGKTMHVDNADLLSQRLSGAIVSMKMVENEVDPIKVQMVMTPPDISVRNVSESGETESSEAANILMPIAFMMLLWISTFTGGQYLLTSTVEEKTNKIIEVVLSGTSPMQLMTGKILGQGAVALTMLVLYAALAVGALQKFELGYLVEPGKVVLFAPYFFMAFFFIACMMAAVGSAVNEMREAQALMGPVMMIVILPWLAWMPIVKSPNGSLATILSFIPPMTPFVMALRLGTNQVIPMWQIAATLIIGFAAVFLFIWMTAKIFRIGILMHGKAPNFMTLLRWVRMA